MRRVRSLFAYLLALVLTFSTAGFGMASGQTPGVGQMVLCTGHGIITVEIGPDGQPVERMGICPDFATTILDLQMEPPAAPSRPMVRASSTGISLGSKALRPFAAQTPPARAPPV